MSKKAQAGAVPVPKFHRGIKGFYTDVIREMKHVTWPTRQEALRLTGVVLAVCVLIAVMLTLLSLGFETILGAIGIGGK